ncbi:hypothetical protein ZIOFF_039994 [Zingiber officinale]|uniref:Polymerase nucleotidyl transferase domain-containing protein n=1 Tax=Zingiber officinale TaxID=94328 RepID=A0A8J5L475_ZINOF|nr:hypothetical protein ZIOFF_039994 [Zingiber officinale]
MGDLQAWPALSDEGSLEEVGQPMQPHPPAVNPDPSAISAENWQVAEKATQDVLRCIQPTVVSEHRRKDVVEYVQKLLKRCIGIEVTFNLLEHFLVLLGVEVSDWNWILSNQVCEMILVVNTNTLQVFPFGSVPLRTYLPDGDIDLTAIGYPNSENALANDVWSVLDREEQCKDAEFEVIDVQYINAEVLHSFQIWFAPSLSRLTSSENCPFSNFERLPPRAGLPQCVPHSRKDCYTCLGLSPRPAPLITSFADTMMRASLNKVMKFTTVKLEARRVEIVDLTKATPEKGTLSAPDVGPKGAPQLATRASSPTRESRSVVGQPSASRPTSFAKSEAPLRSSRKNVLSFTDPFANSITRCASQIGGPPDYDALRTPIFLPLVESRTSRMEADPLHVPLDPSSLGQRENMFADHQIKLEVAVAKKVVIQASLDASRHELEGQEASLTELQASIAMVELESQKDQVEG